MGSDISPSLAVAGHSDRKRPRDRRRSDPAASCARRFLVSVQSDVTITLTSPVTATSYLRRGWLGLSSDAFGFDSLVTVVLVDSGATFFGQSSFDGSQLITAEDINAVVEPMPADFLAWFTARPYVDASATSDLEFGGHPARSLDYAIVEVDGAVPCGPEPVGCVWSVNVGDTAVVHLVGDRGTMLEVDVDGRRLIVDVADRDGAAEIAASVRFSASERPADVADALDLPTDGSLLEPSVVYRWQVDHGDLFRFTAPTSPGVAGGGQNRTLQIASLDQPESLLLVASEAMEWQPSVLEPPAVELDGFDAWADYERSLRDEPVPSDLVAALGAVPTLSVGEPSIRPLGDAEMTLVEVTVIGDVGSTCGGLEGRCLMLFGPGFEVSVDRPFLVGVIAPAPGAEPMYLLATTGAFADEVLATLEVAR